MKNKKIFKTLSALCAALVLSLVASSGISSCPAVSIAESSVSSVKCWGGVVLPSLTVAPERGSV